MPRKTNIGEDGHIIQLGANVRVERGLPTDAKETCRWYIYQRTDVTDDPDTTEDERWDHVADYAETEPGEMPEAAMERAEALAAE